MTMDIHNSSTFRIGFWLLLLALVGGSWAKEKRSAFASPTPVPDPNLTALSGLGGFGSLSENATDPEADAEGGIGNDACTNQDMLTNMLVYQYLQGSIPNDEGSNVANPNIQQLIAGGSLSPATTTVTTVSTTLTTLVVDVEPTTQFSTSTTSYVTTLTSIETQIIPVIFRGSKITTTITESSEEVITATEYFTESTVHSPSIVQTLPVHITMTETSTRGINGQYTLFNAIVGATSVIHQPVSTATLDFDAAGLDISNLDLSQLDLTSFNGGGSELISSQQEQNQLLSMLSSLIQNYNEPGASDFQSNNAAFSDGRNRQKSQGRRNNFESRFGNTFQDDYADYDVVDETPKFNVLSGFTLSDERQANPRPQQQNSNSGLAHQATRYSKYHKKSKPDNNGITPTDNNDRENERFSASTTSTSRRNFRRSSSSQRRAKDAASNTNSDSSANRSPSSRFVPAAESQYFEDTPSKLRSFGPRNDREISSRRRPGLLNNSPKPTSSPAPIFGARQNTTPRPKVNRPRFNRPHVLRHPTINAEKVRTTVLTMYLSGSVPGEYSTSLRTVTLRSLASRRRRDIHEEPASKISPTQTVTPIITESTLVEDMSHGVDPKKVVQLLKALPQKQVKKMIKSLKKWVEYYSHEMLDDVDQNLKGPQLTSSINMGIAEIDAGATTALPSISSSYLEGTTSQNLCHPPSTITETIYRTVMVDSAVSKA